MHHIGMYLLLLLLLLLSLTIIHRFFSHLSWQGKRRIYLKILYFSESVKQNELNNLSCNLKIPVF